MPKLPIERDNDLLTALPDAVWQAWQDQVETVEVHAGEVLHSTGQPPQHVYFPTTATVSLVYSDEDGDSIEIAAIGHEGLVGCSVLMGDGSTPGEAVVQSAGRCVRVPARTLKLAFEETPAVARLMLRHTQALFAQFGQAAVCNRLHRLECRLCRRLLQGFDRSRGGALLMTHEVIASLLGVRREGVTEGARRLQEVGLIRYNRGHIVILDRPGLEQRACGCYGVIRNQYDRVLPELEAA